MAWPGWRALIPSSAGLATRLGRCALDVLVAAAHDRRQSLRRKSSTKRAFSETAGEVGERGPVFWQFRHDEGGATEALNKAESGDATGALEDKRFGYGDIDLVWGFRGIAPPDWKNGNGLSHILIKHPWLEGHLQEMLDRMTEHHPHGPRARTPAGPAGRTCGDCVSWFGRERKTWLLTEYNPTPPATGGNLDGSSNPSASRPTSPLTGGASSSSIAKGKGEVNPGERVAIKAPILTSLPARFANKFGLAPDDAPKLTYNGLGALRSRFIPGGNLGRLEHASVSRTSSRPPRCRRRARRQRACRLGTPESAAERKRCAASSTNASRHAGALQSRAALSNRRGTRNTSPKPAFTDRRRPCSDARGRPGPVGLAHLRYAPIRALVSFISAAFPPGG